MDPYWLTEIFFKIGSHRHKSICASLQVSLAQIDLNRWLAYSPEAALHQNANLKARRSLIYGPYTIMVCFEVLPYVPQSAQITRISPLLHIFVR